jgi:hypothetical protein
MKDEFDAIMRVLKENHLANRAERRLLEKLLNACALKFDRLKNYRPRGGDDQVFDDPFYKLMS